MTRQADIRICLVALLLSPLPARAGDAVPRPQTGPANLVRNGGFEDWSKLPPEIQNRADTKNVRLLPEAIAPADWVPLREISPNREATGTIALDEDQVHSGRRSVRLENRDPRDITCLNYSTETRSGKSPPATVIQPNRRYAVRWWVRGENVAQQGSGPILMMYTVSKKDSKTYRTNASETALSPRGTFDWQRRQLIFITDPYAHSAVLSFQLRWTTGTVWYDDVELLDLGPVFPVETY